MEKLSQYFKIEQLESKAVIDFLPSVIGLKEKKIMEVWRDYFENKQVPYAITKEWIVTKERPKGCWKYKLYKLEKTNEDIGIIFFYKAKFIKVNHG